MVKITVVQLISGNFYAIIIGILLSYVLLLFLRPLAFKFLLLDYPNNRNLHQDETPLTGGISIFLSIFLISFIFFETISFDIYNLFFFGGCMLTLGIIDDKFDLPAFKKLFFQTLITLTFIITTESGINNLGTPLGFSSSLELGFLSFPFTLFAIVCLTNAFNMIDGCDGLASSLIIISLLALLIFDAQGLNHSNQLLIIIVSALLVFLFFNFSNSKKFKIFLGDGGSLFLGFIVAISLVKFADKNTFYDPSIVLWFTAVPIFDFCSIIVMRKLLKRKIMAADRNHIHHLLLSWGLSHFQTTALISSSAMVLLLFGVIVTTYQHNLSFWCFLAFFLLYLSFRIFGIKAR